MRLRIRFDRGVPIQHKTGKNRHLASAAAALLAPATLMAATLVLWRLAADLEWTSGFAISSGLFSHWQVWTVMAAAFVFLAFRLNRYGRNRG